MGKQQETVSLIDAGFEVLEIGNGDIKDFSAVLTADVIMMGDIEIKAVGSVGNLYTKDLALVSKDVQIAVYSAFADCGVLLCDLTVDLFRSGMIGHRAHRFQNQLFLNGVSVSHKYPFRNNALIRNLYQLELYPMLRRLSI